jgi:3-hydroxyisobutyrate dehydrogenase
MTITSIRPDHHDLAANPLVAFLGTGRMGGPMAANLARAGFDVRVWNRTASRAEALEGDGAVAAGSPAQAVRAAAVVITMLADGPATEQAASGPDGLLTASPGTIWVQMARSMLAGDFSPAFALRLALKDAELAAQAAQESGATLTLTGALLPRWRQTVASGHADDDLSAVYLTA